jgi:carbohydrate kinase (thermoresistant glucokinase family)
MVVIVAGVSGVGKTTIGRRVAERLGFEFAEGDEFHPPANVAKMRSGVPLGDNDRRPWLEALRRSIDGWLAEGRNVVVTCSALKRSYREILGVGRPQVVLVYLSATPRLVRERLKRRRDHFMPADLLDSQFEALEPPALDEGAVMVDVSGDPDAVSERIATALSI